MQEGWQDTANNTNPYIHGSHHEVEQTPFLGIFKDSRTLLFWCMKHHGMYLEEHSRTPWSFVIL